MMKKLNPLLLLSVLLAMFMATSCETKSELPSFTYEVAEYEGKDYLDHYYTPNVLFHYAYISQDKKAYEGWLIDNLGNLKTYSFNYEIIDYGDPLVSAAELANLQQKAVFTGKTVDLNDLVDNFKLVSDISKFSLDTKAGDPNAKVNTFVLAYNFDPGNQSFTNSNSCGGSSRPSDSGSFTQVLLKADGQNAVMNKSRLTESVLSWLKEVVGS